MDLSKPFRDLSVLEASIVRAVLGVDICCTQPIESAPSNTDQGAETGLRKADQGAETGFRKIDSYHSADDGHSDGDGHDGGGNIGGVVWRYDNIEISRDTPIECNADGPYSANSNHHRDVMKEIALTSVMPHVDAKAYDDGIISSIFSPPSPSSSPSLSPSPSLTSLLVLPPISMYKLTLPSSSSSSSSSSHPEPITDLSIITIESNKNHNVLPLSDITRIPYSTSTQQSPVPFIECSSKTNSSYQQKQCNKKKKKHKQKRIENVNSNKIEVNEDDLYQRAKVIFEFLTPHACLQFHERRMKRKYQYHDNDNDYDSGGKRSNNKCFTLDEKDDTGLADTGTGIIEGTGDSEGGELEEHVRQSLDLSPLQSDIASTSLLLNSKSHVTDNYCISGYICHRNNEDDNDNDNDNNSKNDREVILPPVSYFRSNAGVGVGVDAQHNNKHEHEHEYGDDLRTLLGFSSFKSSYKNN